MAKNFRGRHINLNRRLTSFLRRVGKCGFPALLLTWPAVHFQFLVSVDDTRMQQIPRH